MPTLWFDLGDIDKDEDEDINYKEPEKLLPEDINCDDHYDELCNEEDDIICPLCGSFVEDGIQCPICGYMVEI
jgi:rubrerythrin